MRNEHRTIMLQRSKGAANYLSTIQSVKAFKRPKVRKKMSKIALQETIKTAATLLDNVDQNDIDAMFEIFVEIELLARDAVTEHSVSELLNVGIVAQQDKVDFNVAA